MKLTTRISWISYSLILLLVPYTVASLFEKNLTILDITINTTRPDIFDVSMKMNRLSRHVFVLNGHYDIKIDLDNRQFIDMKLMHSARGSSKYRQFFYVFRNNTLSKYLNTLYKDVVMNTLQKCNSKFLYFESYWMPPLKSFRAEINQCNITLEHIPSQVPTGYYKVIMIGSGMIDFMAKFVALID